MKKLVLPIMFSTSMLLYFTNFIDLEKNNSSVALTGIYLILEDFPIQGITPNVWFILAFVTGLTGFVWSVLNLRLKFGVCFLLGLAGIAFLLLAQFSIVSSAQIVGYHINIKPSYWLCLLCFALAGSQSYLIPYKISRKKLDHQTKEVVNINIITYTNKENI